MKLELSFESLYELLNKKLPGEDFLPTKIIFMPRGLYKLFHKKCFPGNPFNVDLDTVEDGGVIYGAHIRVFD
jgi:hypothetical protein